MKPMREFIDITESEERVILMWHGGRIEGDLEVQAPKKGRYEAGPGIYFTNNYMTAHKYAKGGKSTYLASIAPDLRFADLATIPLSAGVDFIKATPRMRSKRDLIADLTRNCERMGRDVFTANVLINLVVNYEAGAGEVGFAISKFLRDNGVDAALERQSGDEQWLVVFNPAVILSLKKVPANEVSLDMRHLPKVRE